MVEVSGVVPMVLTHGNSVGRVDCELYLPERSNVILSKSWRKKKKNKKQPSNQPNKQNANLYPGTVTKTIEISVSNSQGHPCN